MNYLYVFFMLFYSSYNHFCNWQPLMRIDKERIVVKGDLIFVLPFDNNERTFFGSKIYNNVVFLPVLDKSVLYERKNSELHLKIAGNDFYLQSGSHIYILRGEQWIKIPAENVKTSDTGNMSLFFISNKSLYEFYNDKIVKIRMFSRCLEFKSLKTEAYGHFVLHCDNILYESFDYGKSWKQYTAFPDINKIVLTYENCWVKTGRGVFECSTGKRKSHWKDIWFTNGILWVLNGNGLLENSEFLFCENFDSLIDGITEILSEKYIISNKYIFKAQVKKTKYLKKTYNVEVDENSKSVYFSSYIPNIILTINKMETERFVEIYSKSENIYSLFINLSWKQNASHRISERERAYFASLSLNDF